MKFAEIIVPKHIVDKSIPDRCFELERELRELSSDKEHKEFIEKKAFAADVVEKNSDLYNELKERGMIRSNIEYFRADENNVYIIRHVRYENNNGKIERIGRLITIHRRSKLEGDFKIPLREWLGEDHPLVVLKKSYATINLK